LARTPRKTPVVNAREQGSAVEINVLQIMVADAGSM
jgi:hypothetical protein